MGEQIADPFSPDPPFSYECIRCGSRTEAPARPGTCPDCGATMRDISVSRE